ncbi:MAG: VOC family protein, partial [Pyrinomonadaceae bacterium]
GSFAGHAGYDGVMLGLPGHYYHLEFTRHEAGSPCPAPSRDNLLVLYVPDRDALLRKVEQLRERGHFPVEPENPYWREHGYTFADPDGWRVVLMNSEGI